MIPLAGNVSDVRLHILAVKRPIADQAGDKAKTIKQGMDLAQKTLDSGQALAKLEHLIKLSNSFT